jgi:hypothetical protein
MIAAVPEPTAASPPAVAPVRSATAALEEALAAIGASSRAAAASGSAIPAADPPPANDTPAAGPADPVAEAGPTVDAGQTADAGPTEMPTLTALASVPLPRMRTILPPRPLDAPDAADTVAPVETAPLPEPFVPGLPGSGPPVQAPTPTAIPEPVVGPTAAAPTTDLPDPDGQIAEPSATAATTDPVAAGPGTSLALATLPSGSVAAGPPEPVSQEAFDETAAELLRPMLRHWLDANMPRIVEKALRRELAQNPPVAPKDED